MPAYTEGDPAVQKVDALIADTADIGNMIDAYRTVNADPEAPPDALAAASDDLDYAYLLARTAGIVARSLRRDL